MPTSIYYQTTDPWVGLTDFLARLVGVDGSGAEGVYWGGATAVGEFGGSGTTYPAFLALVEDDTGRLWPCGASDEVPIDFVDESGTCGLYLLPFDTSELPSYLSGQIGSFTRQTWELETLVRLPATPTGNHRRRPFDVFVRRSGARGRRG
jgi:hypothetical protein